MNLYQTLEKSIKSLAAQHFDAVDTAKIVAEPPKDLNHGDMATNAALVLAPQLKRKPQEVAAELLPLIRALPQIATAEVAGPGFINITLKPEVWLEALADILKTGDTYGNSQMGAAKRVNVEYVSANPTGPMHAGHVRGAVIGDALCNLLAKTGYAVTREYYFNDAGAQVDVLARTTHIRYREALGEVIGAIPEGLYPGEYLKEIGEALVARDGAKWQSIPESEWLIPIREFAVNRMMEMIRADLHLIGIHHEVFSNERDLIEDGTLEKAYSILEGKNLIYTGTLPPPRGKTMEDWDAVPLTLFRSTEFGDSTDRPLKKRDGSWTYFMPDIAYHYDKIQRGFDVLINILGTDHGGYVERMQPVVAAFGEGKTQLKVIFNNIVKVFKNGEPVKLSKRSGNLITLREMVEQVGADAVRFFMLTRDPKSPLDFDFAKVIEQSKDNPVFYVQYAHARAHSVLRHAKSETPDISETGANLMRLNAPAELQLIRAMCSLPRMVEQAALAYEPHRIAFYLHDLASAFHTFWNRGNENAELRFLIKNDKELSQARFALALAFTHVVASGLKILGVTPLEELRA